MKTAYAIVYCIVWPFFNLFHPCRAIGREHVPEGPVIFCPNHTRLSDPLFVAFALGLRFRPQVMAKAELLEIPVLGWILKKVGVFAVERGKSDVGAIKSALKALKGKEKLLIFPEGTRHEEIGEGKTGAAMMAIRTGVPVLPVYIAPERTPFHRTKVYIGEPYQPFTENRRATAEDYEAVTEEIMDHIRAVRDRRAEMEARG